MRRRKSTARQLFGVARLFDILAHIGAGYIGAQNRAEVDRLKAENLALKNQVEQQKIGQQHNQVLKGDLEIELLQLKIKEKEWSNRNKGIDAPEFVTENYREPGDLRHGKPAPDDNPPNF